MTTTLNDFLSELAKSSLIPAEQLTRLRSRLSDDGSVNAKGLARLLVDNEALTPWQAKELMAGRSQFFLGQYKLLEELGSGGSGKVYRALHKSWGREVALKVLAKDLMKRKDIVARFQREAQLAASMNHPNIVGAFDAESEGDVHFLVMEYVKGIDLEKWLQKHGPLPIAWTCECMLQAARGLQHAHEQHMVHRDVKPSNLIVLGSGFDRVPMVKVLDMGFARITTETDEDNTRLTRADQTFGTPDYIAPEQAESTRNADIRADIFSLGCSMFKLLTGELPYPGKTKLQKIMARANRTALPVRHLRPEVPEKLEAIIAKMLARQVEDRFQTPAELAQVLTPFAMSARQAASPPAPSQSALEQPTPSPASPHASSINLSALSQTPPSPRSSSIDLSSTPTPPSPRSSSINLSSTPTPPSPRSSSINLSQPQTSPLSNPPPENPAPAATAVQRAAAESPSRWIG
ncbi:MAG: serine/threonine protein kinase, partial [Planctomycetales bacterium]